MTDNFLKIEARVVTKLGWTFAIPPAIQPIWDTQPKWSLPNGIWLTPGDTKHLEVVQRHILPYALQGDEYLTCTMDRTTVAVCLWRGHRAIAGDLATVVPLTQMAAEIMHVLADGLEAV